MPLWWAEAAGKALRAPEMLICVKLLHLAWQAKGGTFTMPNGWLEKRGVSCRTKVRVLRRLERARLISIEWQRGRAFRVNLNVL
jgi:hypothetical protein